jgi:hypothetical protein
MLLEHGGALELRLSPAWSDLRFRHGGQIHGLANRSRAGRADRRAVITSIMLWSCRRHSDR